MLAPGDACLLDWQTVAEVCDFDLVAGCVRISSSMAGVVGAGAEARGEAVTRGEVGEAETHREAEMYGEAEMCGEAEVSRVALVKTWVEVIT